MVTLSAIDAGKARNIYFKVRSGKSTVLEMVMVALAGIEPARPKAHDFKSCASTSSATGPRIVA